MMPVSLDEGRLYVFVFGPGYGESVAVRVPPDEWLVIDSCRSRSKPQLCMSCVVTGGNWPFCS